MTATRILSALIGFACVSAMGAEPSATPPPSASPAASESPPATQSVSQLLERSKVYRAGAAYSRWLDQIATHSGNAFLQRPVFDRVTWIRLLASVGALALLSIFAGWFVWFVRRHAGEIQSHRYQSALALTASAIRKPFALFLWMCVCAFAMLSSNYGVI